MIQQLHIPSFPLNQFIDHFFYYTAFTAEHTYDRFLPDGEVQLIFDLTDHPKYIFDNESLKEIQTCKKVWFSGLRTTPITIPSGSGNEMLIVQFRKGKAFPFLKVPMHELTNMVVDAELVLRTEILDIRESLVETAPVEVKFRLLEKTLLKSYQLSVNPFVDFAVDKIVNAPQQCSIKQIAEKTGFSQKHIIKLFKQHVGVTPKEFLKIIRFQKAIGQIEKQVVVDWPAVAYDCGFYDQSHFIADFRLFSGFTPTAYLQSRGAFLNYIPIQNT